MSFASRVASLPRLGIGVSTEYGARAEDTLDPAALRAARPEYAGFLELGIETAKGLDADGAAWVARGWPNTYHFLDVNLDEPEDFDPAWLDAVRALVERCDPAWLCGDAGLWHFGKRERGHMLLLPPILSDENATLMAEGIVRLREATGREVLPENPPGTVFLGDLHLLDFFARVCERADTGMLLDCAHLGIYQAMAGHAPRTGLDGFPTERIVELHVAGGEEHTTDGFSWFEDSHTAAVLPATWEIFAEAARRAENLRAVVFECERNPQEACLPGFGKIAALLGERFRRDLPPAGEKPRPARGAPAELRSTPSAPQALQRVAVRMLFDPGLVARVYAEPTSLDAVGPRQRAWLLATPRAAWGTDPFRRSRALRALVEELRLTIWSAGPVRLPQLDAFFSSAAFHACVQSRGSLALAFGAWCAGLFADGVPGAVLALERALAALRRGRPRPEGELALAPGCALATVPTGGLAAYEQLSAAAAGVDVLAALLAPDGARAPRLALGTGVETVLLEKRAEGFSLELLSPALAALLGRAAEGASRAALCAVAREHGAEPGEDAEVLAGMCADGLLCEAGDGA